MSRLLTAGVLQQQSNLAQKEPIMSFQTNFNGSFEPSLNPTSGTLKWVVDGVEQITNSPVFALDGSIVDVKVYANDVVEGTDLTSCLFIAYALIGTIDLSYFRINGQVQIGNNINDISIIFGNYSNVSTNMALSSARIQSLDLSSFSQINGSMRINNNPLIGNQDISLATGSINLYDISNTGFSGDHEFYDNKNYSGTISLHTNSLLTNITFHNNVINATSYNIYRCNLSVVDVSKLVINGNFQFYENPNATTFISGTNLHTISLFRGYSCNFSTMDLSNFTITNQFWMSDNINLSDITYPSFTTGLSFVFLNGCSLPVSKVDEIFSILNTFFITNTPIKNLSVNASGGTNASPTNGANNADILNLQSIFTAAGFTFIATIN